MAATAVYVGAESNSSALAAVTSFNIPIPAGAAVGDVCQVVGHWHNDSVGSLPGGWEQTGLLTTGVVLSTGIWRKILVAGEPGSNVTLTIGTAARAAGGSIVWEDAVSNLDPGEAQTTVVGTAQQLAAGPVTDGDGRVVSVIGLNVSAVTTPTMDTPAGWTKRTEAWTTNPTGNKAGVIIFTRNTDVLSGASSAAVTGIPSVAGRSNSFTQVIKNGSGAPPPAATGWSIGSISMGQI